MQTRIQHIAKCKSCNIYGSSRLGATNDTINMFMPNILPSYGILGNRQYELSNHLGNVLSVISDKPIPKMEEEILEESDYSDGAVLDFDFWSPTTAVIENGRIKVTTHQIYASIVKDIATVPGKIYRVHFTADINNQGGISAYAYDQALLQFLGREKCYSNGDYVMEFMAKSTTSSIRIETYSSFTRDFYIDNVKIEEVVNPIYANDFSTNYTPFSSSGATLSIDNGRLKTVVASQWGSAKLTSLSTQPGVKYRVSFFIDLNNEGDITPFARDVATSNNLKVINAQENGADYFEFTATGTTSLIGFESPYTYSRTFYLDHFFVTYQQNIDAPYETGNTVDYWMADIKSSQDYSPFGVTLSGRDFNSSESRYSFQGQEKDDEIKGKGNSINYTYRMHDPRLGRFFAVDPLFKDYPHNSSYAFSENRVIDGVELEGLEFSGINPMEYFNQQMTALFDNNFGKTAKDAAKDIVKDSYYAVKTTVIDNLGTISLFVTATGYVMYITPAFEFAPAVIKAGEAIGYASTFVEVYDDFNKKDYANASVQIGVAIVFRGTGNAIDKAAKTTSTYKGTTELLISKNNAKILNFINEALEQTYSKIYIPNIQKVGNVTFDSNKAIKQKEGYLMATDINTKEKHKVVRQENGSYEFYQGVKNEIKRESSGKSSESNKGKGGSSPKF